MSSQISSTLSGVVALTCGPARRAASITSGSQGGPQSAGHPSWENTDRRSYSSLGRIRRANSWGCINERRMDLPLTSSCDGFVWASESRVAIPGSTWAGSGGMRSSVSTTALGGGSSGHTAGSGAARGPATTAGLTESSSYTRSNLICSGGWGAALAVVSFRTFFGEWSVLAPLPLSFLRPPWPRTRPLSL